MELLKRKERGSRWVYWLKLALGPLLFFAVLRLPLEGLDEKAVLCLAVYGWLIAWWVLKPIPWLATSLVPLLLFPVLGILSLKAVTAKLYGQRILFLLIFVFLLAAAIRRYGIGKRLSFTLLSLKWVKGSIARFILMYMGATCLMEAIFGIVGLVVSVPIGVAVIEHIVREADALGISFNKRKLGSHIILAGVYGHVAGGIMTIQAVPQNAMVLSLFEEQTGISLSFAQWFVPGLICGSVFFVLSYGLLKLMFRHEIQEIPGGMAYFRKEKEALGPIGRSEVLLSVIVGVIILLWILQTFIRIKGVDFYWIAFLGLFLLYLVPDGSGGGKAFLRVEDAKGLNWDVIFLVTSAVGFSGLMTEMGIIAYAAKHLSSMSGPALLVIAAVMTPLMTNFLAGMATAATMSTLIIPLLAETAIHPLIGVKLIAICAVGLIFPWAGTSAAISYGSQHLDFKDMAVTGVIMAALLGAVMIVLNVLLSGIPWFYPPL